MLTFADVLDALSGVRPEEQGLVISRTVIDSRQAVPRALFIALPGDRVDGHDYVRDAFNHGASIALVQRDMSDEYPQMDLRCEWHPDSLTALGSEHFCLRVENTLASLQQIARFWRHQVDVRVIGITGSVGKTTTKEVVAEVLNQRYRTLKKYWNSTR